MSENVNKYKKYFIIIVPILLIAVIVELILLLKPNNELKSNQVKPNYDEELRLADTILFDSANVIDGKLCDAFIQNKSEDIYGNMGNDSYIINTMYDKIKNFKKVYEDFNKQSLCSRREGDTFKTIEECENFLDGQISYGYEITSYALLDLTRMGFNYVKYYYLDDMNVTGNLSDYGKYEYIIKDNETFRLEMFNNDTIHTNLFYH